MSEVTLDPSATLAGYDRWATTYDTDANPLVAATELVLDRAPLACAGAEVVELGCGTGRHVTRVLAAGARSYTGVDGSPGMLEVARQRTDDPRAHWLLADLRTAYTLARTYDLALVVLVLEHLPELGTLAASLAQCVRPGGALRIVDLHPERIAQGSVARFHEDATEVRFPSIAHDVAALEAALAPAFVVTTRVWHADAELVAAIPKTAKHAGKPLVLDVTATRR